MNRFKISALLLIVGVSLASCTVVRATGEGVEAVGEGAGHAVEALGEGAGHAVSETGRAVQRGVDRVD